MPEELTEENGAKALLIGEFSESDRMACPECCLGEEDDCEVCNGSGQVLIIIPVSWTTIKAIYAMAVKHFGKPILK